ncbi:MAG: DUF4129 domain-containing transglutaminase family protein [Roseiflexaceae bacterium]
MVATSPRNYVPWYLRWDLLTLAPGVILAFTMVWSVVRSIANANWADGLQVLVGVALPALAVGILFARLRWLPGWLAHLLTAALGVAWAIQRIGPLLVDQISQELNTTLADRLVSWGDRGTEILIRTIIWLRVLQVGGRGEDIVLFVVALSLLSWALGYATGWLLFRSGWTWWAVLLNAMTILVNYTFASPKPNGLFFLFLGAALLLLVHQNVVQKQQLWRSSRIEYPEFMPGRFLLAAGLFCGLVVLVTSLLPGNVSNAQVARVWRVVSSPLTAVREGWETAFTTINAPEGSTGNDFSTGGARAGGPRSLGDAVVMRVRSSKFDYWRAIVFDRYTGRGWLPAIGERARAALGVATQVEARTPVEAGVRVPQLDLRGRTVVTQTIEMVQGRTDNLVVLGGEFVSAGLPVLIQHGYMVNEAGLALPNFGETAAIYSQLPLQETRTYTIAALLSTVDEQSLRGAGANYPKWVADYYLQLPDTVTQRTRDKAQEIVREAGATNPYDQALAIQKYLTRFVYDERRPAPPENRDWADYFLFDGQRGYCDDFATTMVVLLRSLKIPARWAQGYAGGTLDTESGAYVVRQSVAHSWPEAYFPGYGWQRFEPTPASYASAPVRPARADDTSSSSSDSTAAADIARQSELDRLRRLEEMLQGSGGDLEASRRALAARLEAERTRQLVIGGGVVAALLAGVVLFFIRLRREVAGLSPAATAYVRLGRMAAWAGLPQGAHITPYEYGGELGRSLPGHGARVDRIVGAYVAERYRPGESQPADGFEQDWQALRTTLLGRMLRRIAAAARPTTERRNGARKTRN